MAEISDALTKLLESSTANETATVLITLKDIGYRERSSDRFHNVIERRECAYQFVFEPLLAFLRLNAHAHDLTAFRDGNCIIATLQKQYVLALASDGLVKSLDIWEFY